MIVSDPERFAAAVRSYQFDEVALDGTTLRRAARSLARSGLLLVGEPHGVHETPAVLHAIAAACDTRAIVFEWSHEELEGPVRDFLQGGAFDFERLWSLPPSAELFCGDGRITAGHFALLARLRDEGRLDQVILFDRLDPEPPLDDWRPRDREMSERLSAVWDDRLPLLAVAGAFHAQLDLADGDTMASHLARERPALRPVMLDYAGGQCWSRGERHDVSGPMPQAPITLRLPAATPAIVPGRAAA